MTMTPEALRLIHILGIILTIYGLLGSQGGKEESTWFLGYTLVAVGVCLLIFFYRHAP